jgi:broad specificity phosphatase PhoE
MGAPLTLLLVRHGESCSNAAAKVALPESEGDRLTERGHEQAREAARRLRGVHAGRLFTSPLRRARETAAPLASALGLEPEVAPELIEVREGDDYGTLELDEQLARRFSQRMGAGGPPPAGADSFEAVVARVRAFKERLDAEEGSTVVAVGHGIFARFFLMDSLLGERFTADLAERLWQLGSVNCGVSTFDRRDHDAMAAPTVSPWRCITWMERPDDL